MRQLRNSKQRDEKNLYVSQIPVCAEQPVFLMQHAAMPEQLFRVSQSPERGEKNKPVRRQRLINPGSVFAPLTRVKIYQGEIRNPVNDDVCHRESIVGIEKNNPDIPADGGRRDDDVFADIQKTAREIKIN